MPMTVKKINLPLLELRDYQKKVWHDLFKNNVKKAFLLWHRRAGKDLFCFQYMVAQALKTVGNYFYIFPLKIQARRAMWEGITKDGQKYLSFCPQELVLKKCDAEMKLILRHPDNPFEAGSIISFLGGDDFDSLLGAGIQGAVISEFALQKPQLYNLAVEPMLKETHGWVIFNTTPRGNNHAFQMFKFLEQNPKYLTSKLTILDTSVVSNQELEEERKRGKDEALIQQEYFCSFSGALQGAYYADILDEVLQKNSYDPVYDPAYPVHTLWDLGVSDTMVIWFVQFIQNQIYLIDYYQNTSFALAHYAQIVLSKNYLYAGHHLPHDGNKRQLTSTEKALSVKKQLENLGLNLISVQPRTSCVYADICAVRSILPKCFFNRQKCEQGIEALRNYRREWDDKNACFKNTPLHDWTSHASDAFRLIPFIEKKIFCKFTPKEAKKWNGNF